MSMACVLYNMSKYTHDDDDDDDDDDDNDVDAM